MAKTQEELNELKKEYEALNAKLEELTADELTIATGGDVVIHNMPKKSNRCNILASKGTCPYTSYQDCILYKTGVDDCKFFHS